MQVYVPLPLLLIILAYLIIFVIGLLCNRSRKRKCEKPPSTRLDTFAMQQDSSVDPESKRIYRRFAYVLNVMSYLFYTVSIILITDTFLEPSVSCFARYCIDNEPKWEMEPKIYTDATIATHSKILDCLVHECRHKHTAKLIEMADNLVISLTIMIIGIIISEVRKNIVVHDLKTFLTKFKEIDVSILAMVAISLLVHFLSEVISNEHPLDLSFALGIGFIVLSISAYIYCTDFLKNKK